MIFISFKYCFIHHSFHDAFGFAPGNKHVGINIEGYISDVVVCKKLA